MLAFEPYQAYSTTHPQNGLIASALTTPTNASADEVELHRDTAILITSADAKVVSLDYGARNSLDALSPSEDFYFDHATREIPLTRTERLVNLSNLPFSLIVSNPFIFQTSPYINQEGNLVFKPSGKPGVNAVSTIRFMHGVSEVETLTIAVVNEEHHRWSLVSPMEKGNLAFDTMDAEGEGFYGSFGGSSDGGGYESSGSYSNSGSSSGISSGSGSSSSSGGGSSSGVDHQSGSSGSYHCSGIGYLQPYDDNGHLLPTTETIGSGDPYHGEFACGHTQYTVGNRFFIGTSSAVGGVKYIQEWNLQSKTASNQSDIYVYHPDAGQVSFNIPQPLGYRQDLAGIRALTEGWNTAAKKLGIDTNDLFGFRYSTYQQIPSSMQNAISISLPAGPFLDPARDLTAAETSQFVQLLSTANGSQYAKLYNSFTLLVHVFQTSGDLVSDLGFLPYATYNSEFSIFPANEHPMPSANGYTVVPTSSPSAIPPTSAVTIPASTAYASMGRVNLAPNGLEGTLGWQAVGIESIALAGNNYEGEQLFSISMGENPNGIQIGFEGQVDGARVLFAADQSVTPGVYYGVANLQTLTIPFAPNAAGVPEISRSPLAAVTGSYRQFSWESGERQSSWSYVPGAITPYLAVNPFLADAAHASPYVVDSSGNVHGEYFDYQTIVPQPFALVVGSLSAGNHAPVILSNPETEAKLGIEYSYTALGVDVDGDPITYSIINGPSDATIDSITGVLSWKSPIPGDHFFRVRASDPYGLFAEKAFTVSTLSLNRAPRIDSTPNTDAKPGDEYLYLVTAVDPDGDAITLNMGYVPGWEIEDHLNGTATIRYSPKNADAGLRWPIQITATDRWGATNLQNFTVTVGSQLDDNNLPPVITSEPKVRFQTAGSGLTSVGDVTVTSPQNQSGKNRLWFNLESEETADIGLQFSIAAGPPKVDVMLLLDDTGSFVMLNALLRNEYTEIIKNLSANNPGIDFGFGVSRFDDFRVTYDPPLGGRDSNFETGIPFTLNQPIITPNEPRFTSVIRSALNRASMGSGGGDVGYEEALVEALFQLGAGVGNDGNGNGSSPTQNIQTCWEFP